MANRDLQKKAQAERNKKIHRKDLMVKSLIISVVLLAIVGVIVFSVVFNKDSEGINNQELIDGETETQYVVLNLGSTVTCEPCRQLKPVVDALKSKYSGEIDILSYDVSFSSKGASLASEYNVQSIPTLVFLKDGVEVYRTVGYRNQSQIESDFEKLGWI